VGSSRRGEKDLLHAITVQRCVDGRVADVGAAVLRNSRNGVRLVAVRASDEDLRAVSWSA